MMGLENGVRGEGWDRRLGLESWRMCGDDWRLVLDGDVGKDRATRKLAHNFCCLGSDRTQVRVCEDRIEQRWPSTFPCHPLMPHRQRQLLHEFFKGLPPAAVQPNLGVALTQSRAVREFRRTRRTVTLVFRNIFHEEYDTPTERPCRRR